MTKNIKEIGKELLGKSLNSYHRRTGLTQLEENNKMQDDILDRIFNQINNNFLEKTEETNTILLENSGEGTVILDKIEGNTVVNFSSGYNSFQTDTLCDDGENIKNVDGVFVKGGILWTVKPLKPNTDYTFIINILECKDISDLSLDGHINYSLKEEVYLNNIEGVQAIKFTTREDMSKNIGKIKLKTYSRSTSSKLKISKKILILEGDWTNREIPEYFEGMKSSFENQIVNDRYKINLTINNGNVFDYEKFENKIHTTGIVNSLKNGEVSFNSGVQNGYFYYNIDKNYIDTSKDLTFSVEVINSTNYRRFGMYCRQKNFGVNYGGIAYFENTGIYSFTIPANTIKDDFMFMIYSAQVNGTNENIVFKNMTISYNDKVKPMPHKENSISFLINEPLRGIDDIKDTFTIKDNKLMIERKCKEIVFTDNPNDFVYKDTFHDGIAYGLVIDKDKKLKDAVYNSFIPRKKNTLSDKFTWYDNDVWYNRKNYYYENRMNYVFVFNWGTTKEQAISKLVGSKFIYLLENPVYEEVLNEYGEPILLEGYENGTLYVDSTIAPTTTVRHTPKMESFNTLKEVKSGNNLLTDDINDNIIPYMMDVDLMIMEKEVALMSQKNIRKIGAEDMTSMQKRTQQMLERLIKGRTLTEQECQTRVTTYLNAGKITDEQAEELMLLIEKVYA